MKKDTEAIENYCIFKLILSLKQDGVFGQACF